MRAQNSWMSDFVTTAECGIILKRRNYRQRFDQKLDRCSEDAQCRW